MLTKGQICPLKTASFSLCYSLNSSVDGKNVTFKVSGLRGKNEIKGGKNTEKQMVSSLNCKSWITVKKKERRREKTMY